MTHDDEYDITHNAVTLRLKLDCYALGHLAKKMFMNQYITLSALVELVSKKLAFGLPLLIDCWHCDSSI